MNGETKKNALSDPFAGSEPVEEERQDVQAFIAARRRFAEAELAAALERGVRQYVVLGAGLDTFAGRRSYPVAELEVFEVDHPTAMKWRESSGQDGLRVTFVPTDFETETLSDALHRSGFKPGTGHAVLVARRDSLLNARGGHDHPSLYCFYAAGKRAAVRLCRGAVIAEPVGADGHGRACKPGGRSGRGFSTAPSTRGAERPVEGVRVLAHRRSWTDQNCKPLLRTKCACLRHRPVSCASG